MKGFIHILLVLSLFLTFSTTYSQVDVKKKGQSTMNFLKVGISPRATGMGNAYTSICNDVESIFYNPAGLTGTSSRYSAFVSQTQWIADINYQAGAVALNLGTLGTFAVSALTVDYGDIQGARLHASDDGQGYLLTDNVDVNAYAFGLAYARQISQQFSMGGLVQYVGQKLGDSMTQAGATVENAQSTVTLNFGVKYITDFKNFRFAMSLRNFSTSVKYEEYSAHMPIVFAVGTGIDVLDVLMSGHNGNPLMLSAEFLHPNNYTERVNVGGEYVLLDMIALRAGYEFNRDLYGLSAGFGLSPQLAGNRLSINYSYSSFDVFEDVNRFSLNIAF